MAYHIYSTEAFVLNERPAGEANKIYDLLTPDLGRIAAVAQGVRLLKSKLRFNLVKYSRARVCLVRGKDIWILTGAEKNIETEEVLADLKKQKLVAKIFTLLAHFIHGEGEQFALYDDLAIAIEYLKKPPSADLTERDLRGWELALDLRLLYRLGYVKNEPELTGTIAFKEWSESELLGALSKETEIVEAVNSALRASHF